MKKAENMTKPADSCLQDLPGQTRSLAHRQDRPAKAQASCSVDLPAEAPVLAHAVASAMKDDRAVANASVPASSPPVDEAHLLSVERTHDLVALHALRLRESGDDKMRVVIEPGKGVQLSVELRWRGDGVEAQALLHGGDFELLGRHWAELQQRLETRGVHLGALQCATQSAGDHSQFQQSDRHSSKPQSQGSPFADFAFGGSMTESPRTGRSRAKTHCGWETWA